MLKFRKKTGRKVIKYDIEKLLEVSSEEREFRFLRN